MKNPIQKRIYLDHNATTQVLPQVREAVLPFLGECFGNPSSLHAAGRAAKKGLEQAREQVAALVGARPENIFFTSGGTEANNLAILGAARFARKKHQGNHIVTTAVEHEAVLAACRYLAENEGFDLTVLPVDKYGLVSADQVLGALREETILVSVMMANNEIGTIEPIEAIGQRLREKKVLFHTDAVQAINTLKVDVAKLPVDLLSLSGHKFGAMKGIGALYVRSNVRLHPLQHGGDQEMTLRSGTENVVGAVSLGRAAELVAQNRETRVDSLHQLREKLWHGIESHIKGVYLNGHPEKRLANTVSVSFDGAEGEAVLLALDMEGIAASSGSACASGSVEPSHVLQAIGLPTDLATNTVRFSLGVTNTEEEIDQVISVLPKIISRIRLANGS